MKQMLITEQNKYSTTDIAKWIRQELKKQFPNFKFSVTTELYSGGGSIHLAVMQSPIRLVKKFEEITEHEILRLITARNDSEEEIKEMIKRSLESGKISINDYHLDSSWDLTNEGKEILKKIIKIANTYNYDNSDSQIDYFDVNYYLHISLGKYDKPFIDGASEGRA